MKRRTFLPAAGLGLAALKAADQPSAPQQEGRIKQSVCRWCYNKIPMDEFAKACSMMGLQAMDLVEPKDWPILQKYGLAITVAPGPTSIPDGFNRKENHDEIVKKFKPMVDQSVAAGAKSMIVFSGNRKGMSDQEGAENCIIGLNKIKGYAEDKGILVVMELLNSKVNHKDYMCDHTAWGVEVVKAVNSPNIKLLYDIYHMQIMEGDTIRTIQDNIQYIGHFHTGGNPGRHEIDSSQESNYKAISKAIADTGFQGYMAHEFIPVYNPMVSLAQAIEICKV
jgi:hydroxypyruvate isomerase